MLSRITSTDSLLQLRAGVSAKLSQLIGFPSCPEITLEMFNSPDEGTGSSLLQDFTGEDSVLLNDLDSTADSDLVQEIPFFFLSSCIIGFDSCCSCESNINKRKAHGYMLNTLLQNKAFKSGSLSFMKLISDIASYNDIQLVSCTQGTQLEKVKCMQRHRSDRVNSCRREFVMSIYFGLKLWFYLRPSKNFTSSFPGEEPLALHKTETALSVYLLLLVNGRWKDKSWLHPSNEK